MQVEAKTRTLGRYVPRMLLGRLAEPRSELVETLEGTTVFADVSGFTRLSERLARKGKEGAEHLVDAINHCFSELLADVSARGGSLLKFGGDAMLLWFDGDGHTERGVPPRPRCSQRHERRGGFQRAVSGRWVVTAGSAAARIVGACLPEG